MNHAIHALSATDAAVAPASTPAARVDQGRVRVNGDCRRCSEELGAGSRELGVRVALDFAWMHIARKGLEGFGDGYIDLDGTTQAASFSVELDAARRATAQLLSGGDPRRGVWLALQFARRAVDSFGLVSVQALAQRREAELVAAAAPPLSFRSIPLPGAARVRRSSGRRGRGPASDVSALTVPDLPGLSDDARASSEQHR